MKPFDERFCETVLSDASVSAPRRAEPWLYTGLLFYQEANSKVHLSLSDLFGFLQEVQ